MGRTTYLGDPARKDALVMRAIEHRDSDRLWQGFGYFMKVDVDNIDNVNEEVLDLPGSAYLGQWKGCAIGCLATPVDVPYGQYTMRTQEGSARVLREEFGIPTLLTMACESVFEGLSQQDAYEWPELFARALPIGVSVGNKRVRRFVEESSFFDYMKAEPGHMGDTYIDEEADRGRDELLDWIETLEHEAEYVTTPCFECEGRLRMEHTPRKPRRGAHGGEEIERLLTVELEEALAID